MTAEESGSAARPGGLDPLLMPGEVAVYFRVDPKTVTRWCASGRLGAKKTPGGQWRIPASQIRQEPGKPDTAIVDGTPALCERTSR